MASEILLRQRTDSTARRLNGELTEHLKHLRYQRTHPFLPEPGELCWNAKEAKVMARAMSRVRGCPESDFGYDSAALMSCGSA